MVADGGLQRRPGIRRLGHQDQQQAVRAAQRLAVGVQHRLYLGIGDGGGQPYRAPGQIRRQRVAFVGVAGQRGGAFLEKPRDLDQRRVGAQAAKGAGLDRIAGQDPAKAA